MKYRLIILAAGLTLLLSACTLSLASDITPPPNYQSPTPAPTMSPLFPQSAPNLADGANIYTEKCAPCHGEQGLGDGPMAAQLQKAPKAIGKPEIGRAAAPANWYTTVTQGNINSFMPPFNASLSDQQRWDVVAYAISLGGSTGAEAEKGKAVYVANCTKCHGEGGNGIENVDFTNQALMAKLTQDDIANFTDKGVGSMQGFGGLIPQADVYAVAAYVRAFSVNAGDETAAVATATPEAPQATATPEAIAGAATAGTPTVSTEAAGTPQATPATTDTAAATATPSEVVSSIGGAVKNGSGGALPADLKAVLHVFEHDTATKQFKEVATQQAPVAADGSYKFEKVSMPANQAYYVSVDYANTTYESDPIFPKEGETSFDMPLTIYDTTTDSSGLTAEQVHVLLDYSKPDVVQVVEFIVISNPGTKSIVPAEKGGPVVSLSLPKGYTNLQFEQGGIGDRYLKTDNGFADTTTVVPGMKNYQVVFAIDLPLTKPGLFGGQKFEFTQPFPLKVTGLSVLVPEGVTVEGSNFTPGGVQDMGTGVKYQVYSTSGVAAGESLTITAAGLPKSASQPVASTSNGSQNIIIGVGAFGLVLIIAGVWMYVRERRQSQAAAESDEDETDAEEGGNETGVDEVMDAIVALDDQYKAGNIQEAAYKERRAELKAKLKNIL
ncbi:MAG TPA: c-type cytochrome [Anaerolineales bacterium]|jgi:mono/diheme cytochrome c family protein